MRKRKILKLCLLFILISITLFGSFGFDVEDNFTERVKIALRDSGNRLLLTNQDSTSLILPVVELDKYTYQFSFQHSIFINPDSLISIIGNSLKTSNLSTPHIVEVVDNSNQEVSYSYEIKDKEEASIIPCIGRNLPKAGYSIRLLFTEQSKRVLLDGNYSLLSLAFIGLFGFVLLDKRRLKKSVEAIEPVYSTIGSYSFYQDQKKMIKGDRIIELSSKECELMSLFGARPNQIIKREFLMKEVWEDNGVFVGRSLDTFISKIRKKFIHDKSFNIVAVHGVGYRLEIH